MSAQKKPSWKTVLGSVGVWALKSGVGGVLLIGLIYGVMEIGSLRENARWQEKNMRAHEESHKARMERIDEKNAAQDEKMTEHGETLATIQVILERIEKSLTRLENKLDTLVNKVDTLLLRDSKGSASLENEGSAKNVSTSLCM